MSNKSVDQLIQRLKQLKVEEPIVIQQLEEARRTKTGQTDHPHIGDIVIDNRVKITNRVRNLKGINVTNADRLKTVTCTDKKKIYFTTDNDTETWRLPKNLNKIP